IPGPVVARRTLLSIAIAGAMFGSLSSPATALAETSDLVELDTLTVVDHTTTDVDTLVTREEIEQLQANDLEDVFRADPSISVGGANSVSQKIYLRGIEDTLLNVTIDGATQAGYLFHHQGRLSIEPELLK